MDKSVAIFLENRWILNLLSERFKVIPLPEAQIAKTEDFFKPFEPSRFDWLILNDYLSTKIFLEKLKLDNYDLFNLDEIKICAGTESVFDLLRLHQIHSDLVATDGTVQSIFNALTDYVDRQFGGLNVAVFKEKNQKLQIAELLEKERAKVTEISLYELKLENRKELLRLKTLVKGGAIDAIVFASPEETLILELLFREDLSDLLSQMEIFAADEMTFQALIEKKLRARYLETLVSRK
ncbi:MAG: uroporphyrinogen-III synthase [Pyrinomonadaceae bacterium]|nr:uroporphyrinogen-III synthase [Pyrinomonadaceae bacterium]MCX7640485.1 uroporphyrinogen-III synthase [Pyrinomonadaceae bacterium]MDW8305182.1 uroporphyrinogen-III synthase [Acidobacteriota bacterium]